MGYIGDLPLNELVIGDTPNGLNTIPNGNAGYFLVSTGTGTNAPDWAPIFGSVNFSARLSADATNATGDGTPFTIICDTVITNVGSGYNNSTGTFTAPVSGFYLFSCIIATELTTSTPTVGLVSFAGHAFDSNPENMSTSSSTGLSLNYTQLVQLNASDTVTLSVTYSGSTKAVTVQGGSGSSGCFMSGFLIMPT